MNLDSLVTHVCQGNINLPSALVLCVLIVAGAAVLITWVKSVWGNW
jgi:hypothetical protein